MLQEKEFERVGGSSTVDVDVRVVAATHRDLETEVQAGRFRDDLYYRLNVVEIAIPPLRERLEDLPALAERFLTQVAERLERDKKTIGEEALAALARHAWPGNVRELRNAIEQALVLSPGSVIGPEDLRIPGGPASEPSKPVVQLSSDVPFRDAKKHAVESFERGYLIRALRAHDGNISRTAESIGMVRQSLQQKIRELGLRSEEWNGDA